MQPIEPPPAEPRSFAPTHLPVPASRRDLQVAPVKSERVIDRINESRPTMRALARHQNQLADHQGELHDCLEGARADITEIKQALGLREKGKTDGVSGLSSPFKAFRRTVYATTTSIITLALIYRIAMALWPSLEMAFAALNRLALSAHI